MDLETFKKKFSIFKSVFSFLYLLSLVSTYAIFDEISLLVLEKKRKKKDRKFFYTLQRKDTKKRYKEKETNYK